MATTSPTPPTKTVIIVGGGVIGCATAFFLTHPELLPSATPTTTTTPTTTFKPVIIEAASVAHAASGKAGGFLALDWCDGLTIQQLARTSFALHKKLNDYLGGEASYGFRRLRTVGVDVGPATSSSSSPSRSSCVPDWVDGAGVTGGSVMGTTETTAQVTPFDFCHSLLTAAQSRGAELMERTVVADVVLSDDSGMAVGVKLADGTEVKGDYVVLCTGPWCAGKRWPSLKTVLPDIGGTRAHSVVFAPPPPTTTTTPPPVLDVAVFVETDGVRGVRGSSEVYPRPDGTVYMCGMSDTVTAVPDSAVDGCPCDASACAGLAALAQDVASTLGREFELRTTGQACFLPTSPDDVPVIGGVPGVGNVFIATGHSCWGVLNGPATGASLTEALMHGEGGASVDLSVFSVKRFL